MGLSDRLIKMNWLTVIVVVVIFRSSVDWTTRQSAVAAMRTLETHFFSMHLNKAIKPDLIVKLIELVRGGCLAPLSQLKTGYLLVCLPIKCLQYSTHAPRGKVGLSKEGTLTLLGNNYFIWHAGGPEVQKLRAHYMDGLYTMNTMTTFNWISISILYLTLVSIV